MRPYNEADAPQIRRQGEYPVPPSVHLAPGTELRVGKVRMGLHRYVVVCVVAINVNDLVRYLVAHL